MHSPTITTIVIALLTLPAAAITGLSGKTLQNHKDCDYAPAKNSVVWFGKCKKHSTDPTLDWCQTSQVFGDGKLPLCDYQYHNDPGMTACWPEKIRDTHGDKHGSIYGCKTEGNTCLVFQSSEFEGFYVTRCGGFSGSEREPGNELNPKVAKLQGLL